mgnify:CR=1 FL=1
MIARYSRPEMVRLWQEEGWDVVEAHIPEAEIQNLIVELRSATAGVGTFNAKFDHLAELNGPLAEKVIQQRVPEPA